MKITCTRKETRNTEQGDETADKQTNTITRKENINGTIKGRANTINKPKKKHTRTRNIKRNNKKKQEQDK